jgi:superfamily II RNA helicase
MQYSGFTLDPFQAEAITHLQAGKSVLVTAPTGTGKTIIADWLVENAIKAGKSVIFTAPVKALSNQKFRDYCRLYGEEKVGLLTGDLVIRREAPCLVMTTEILRNILLSGDSLGKLSAVILDEIHFLDDPERGTVWEEVLIYLPKEIQILGLSATLSNVQEFSRWLGEVRDQEVAVVIEEVRTVPLHLFVGDRTGGLWEIEAYVTAVDRTGCPKPHTAIFSTCSKTATCRISTLCFPVERPKSWPESWVETSVKAY